MKLCRNGVWGWAVWCTCRSKMFQMKMSTSLCVQLVIYSLKAVNILHHAPSLTVQELLCNRLTSGHRWITVPSFFFPFLRLCLLARAAPSRPSTATSKNWRSPSLPSPLCPLAPRSMWLVTGRPIRTRMVGTSTTIAPPRRGPGSHLEPGTIAPETCKERATAPERAQR